MRAYSSGVVGRTAGEWTEAVAKGVAVAVADIAVAAVATDVPGSLTPPLGAVAKTGRGGVRHWPCWARRFVDSRS